MRLAAVGEQKEGCHGETFETQGSCSSHHGLKDVSEKDRLRARAAVQDAFCVPKGGYNLY